MLTKWKLIFLIFLTIDDYNQIINAAEQSAVNLIKPIHYLIKFHLSPKLDQYYGNVTIQYVALESFNELIVDGILDNMQLIEPSNTAIINERRNGKLQNIKFMRNHSENETYTIRINFQNAFNRQPYGIYRATYFQSSFIATQFEPAYARHGFPCFDHPALKAEFEVIIDRPSEYKCLSNMPIYRTQASPDVADRHIDYFQKSVKMSSYLLAFCVSKFENLTNGIVSTWAPKEILDDTKISLQFLSDILKFFERYFNFKYNLPKLDVIAVHLTSADGMENWGLITMNEKRLINNRLTSYDEKIFNKLLLTHEIVHQWIGNVITHDWWNDMWLTEGLTTYLEYIGIDGIMPQLKIWDSYGIDVLQYCFELDLFENEYFKLRKTLPDDTVGLANAFNIFTYRKGSAIIRMFVSVAPTHAIQELLRNIIRKYSFSTITANNFFKMLADIIIKYNYDKTNSIENYIGRMQSWITNTGYPLVTVNVSRNRYSPTTFRQQRYGIELNANDSLKYWIPISYTTSEYLNFNNAKSVLWMSNETEIVRKDKIVLQKNEWLIINLYQTGYYRVNYDNENWNAIINYLNNKSIFSNIPTANRMQLIDDAFQMASKNLINATIPLNLIKYIKHETELGPWQAAGKQFDMLLNVMQFKIQYEYLKNFINESVAKLYMDLGFTNTKDVNEHKGLQRIYILQLACTVDRKHCVDKSLDLFSLRYHQLVQNVKIDLNSIDLNHCELIYCKGMENADDRKWNFIHANRNLLENEKEVVMFSKALTCTRNSALLEKYLYEILVEPRKVGITFEIMLSIIHSLHKNPIGHNIFLNFMWTFMEEIKLRWPTNYDLLRILEVPIKYIYYKYQVNEYERILDSYFGNAVPPTILKLLKLQEAAVITASNSFGEIEHFLNMQK